MYAIYEGSEAKERWEAALNVHDNPLARMLTVCIIPYLGIDRQAIDKRNDWLERPRHQGSSSDKDGVRGRTAARTWV